MTDPQLVIIESRTTDHAAAPWVVGPPAGPIGVAVDAGTQKAVVHLELSATAGVTMDVEVYGRRKGTGTSVSLGTVTSLEAEPGGAYDFHVDDPELYDMIATYVTGATWAGATLKTHVLQSQRPGLLASVFSAISGFLALLVAALVTIGTAVRATALQIAGSDGTNARLFRLDNDGHTQADVLSSALPTGAATETKLEAVRALLATIDADTSRIPALGTAAMATSAPVTVASNDVIMLAIKTALEIMDDWDSSDHAKTYPHPEYTDGTTILNAVTADTGAPSTVADGEAFQSDTKHAYLEIWCTDEEVGVANADVNIYLWNPNSETWNIPAGGALADLQAETNNRWGVKIPLARLIGTRVAVEVDNYVAGAATMKVSAKMTEVTA